MNKVIKWVLGISAAVVLFVVAVVIFLPKFVNLEQYRPQIESRVSQAIGRPFSLGGELDLSLFPWAGVSFSNLTIGSLPGFSQEQFLTVDSFEIRVKVLPLLFRDIQVKRFVLNGPRVVLEKLADGRVNWEFKPGGKGPEPSDASGSVSADGEKKTGFSVKALAVEEFSVADGVLIWIDQGRNERRQISGIRLDLEDVSLDKPIKTKLMAVIDQQPFSVNGVVGPLGVDVGKEPVALDLVVQASDQIHLNVQGRVAEVLKVPRYDIQVDLKPFSPRKAVQALFPEEAFPVETSDPKALGELALTASIKGDAKRATISSGVIRIDESTIKLTMNVNEFDRPNLAFDVDLDQIDLDRYLPPVKEGGRVTKASGKAVPNSGPKVDYRPLRRLVLDGHVHVGALKAANARLNNVDVKVSAQNGMLRIEPLEMDLYQGHVRIDGTVNVQQDAPRSSASISVVGIRVGPLLADVKQMDMLEGGMEAAIEVDMQGDDPDQIRQTLAGSGVVRFFDGAVKGIDLPGMVRNAKAAFGLGEDLKEKPRTDFSELRVPFQIRKGGVETSNARLESPVLRVMARGKADLVKELLDFRLEPKFVATLIGQGDTVKRTGIMVPVLVSGSFSSPKFRPDLKGLMKQTVGEKLPKMPDVEKMAPDKERLKETIKKPLEEGAKELLKGLPFGN